MRIGRQSVSFALYPYQAKITSRGASGVITFIQEYNLLPEALQAPGDGYAQNAAANDCVLSFHVFVA